MRFASFILIFLLITPAYAADLTPVEIIANDKKVTFNVEIADTYQKRILGLMHRTELADDEGILFIFPNEKIISMWMKDTLISLDMIFIDGSGVIRDIAHNTTPESLDSISSKVPCRYVLEIKAGMAKKHGIKLGNNIRF